MRDTWVLEGAESLKHRIDGMSEALDMSEPSVEELEDLGYSNSLSIGIVSAIGHYGEIPMERYKDMLLDSLRYLIPEEGGSEDLPEPEEDEPEPEDDEYEDIPPEPPVMEPEPEPIENCFSCHIGAQHNGKR